MQAIIKDIEALQRYVVTATIHSRVSVPFPGDRGAVLAEIWHHALRAPSSSSSAGARTVT